MLYLLKLSDYAKLYSDAGICFNFKSAHMQITRERFNKFFEIAQEYKKLSALPPINREDLLDKRVNLMQTKYGLLEQNHPQLPRVLSGMTRLVNLFILICTNLY